MNNKRQKASSGPSSDWSSLTEKAHLGPKTFDAQKVLKFDLKFLKLLKALSKLYEILL